MSRPRDELIEDLANWETYDRTQDMKLVHTYNNLFSSAVNACAFAPRPYRAIAIVADDGAAVVCSTEAPFDTLAKLDLSRGCEGVDFAPAGFQDLEVPPLDWFQDLEMPPLDEDEDGDAWLSHLYVLVGTYGFAGQCALWNVKRGVVRTFHQGSTSLIMTVAFSPTGEYFATASNDAMLRVWNTGTAECLHKLSTSGACVTVRWDANYLAYGTHGGNVYIAETSNVLELDPVQCKEHTDYVRGVAVHPSGKYVASACDDGTVFVWSTETMSVVRRFKGHTEWVRGLYFSRFAGDNLLLSLGKDHCIAVWDFEAGKCVHKQFGHLDTMRQIKGDYDESLFATASYDSTVKLWAASPILFGTEAVLSFVAGFHSPDSEVRNTLGAHSLYDRHLLHLIVQYLRGSHKYEMGE